MVGMCLPDVHNIKYPVNYSEFYQENRKFAGSRHGQGDRNQENALPEVKIISPEHLDTFTWNDQVRYIIRVTDVEDGDSRYDEIQPNDILLEVEFLPGVEKELTEYEKAQRARKIQKRCSPQNCKHARML